MTPQETRPDAVEDAREFLRNVEETGCLGAFTTPQDIGKLQGAKHVSALLAHIEAQGEEKRCTCTWEHPATGAVEVWPAELDPACWVHGQVDLFRTSAGLLEEWADRLFSESAITVDLNGETYDADALLYAVRDAIHNAREGATNDS